MIKIVLDGTVNSKLGNEQKVAILAIDAHEFEHLLSTPPLEIKRHRKRASIAYDGTLLIRFKPYKATDRYVKKINAILGEDLFLRLRAIACRDLSMGGTVIRKPIVHLEPNEIEAIISALVAKKALQPVPVS